MERKGRKAITKKLIAILCIFVVLQTYFSYFAQIAIAIVDETVIGGSSSETSDDDVTIGGGEDQENPDNETVGGETETPPEDEPVVGGSGEENPEEPSDDETTVGGNPFLEGDEENPDEGNTGDGSIIIEDPENPEGEEPTEPTGEEQEEPEEPTEEEPYVEPEATIEVTSPNSSIYKGYLYANATSDMSYETYYTTNDTITVIGGKNLLSLTVQDESDKVGLITNRKLDLGNNTYYRQTRVSVDEFNNVLGKDGSITVYSPDGGIIAYINKDSTVVGNEYVIVYQTQFNSIRFELTNIKEDGSITFKNDKAIKDNQDYDRNQISLFTTINTTADVNLYEEGKEVKNYRAEGNINLEETESKMLIDTDTTTLAVEGKNEVAINVTLKTDEERYDLFENPTINIEFPSAIKELNVTGVNLLYRNGLSIDKWDVTTNNLGKKVLNVSLSGAQSEYMPGSVSEGTTLVLYTEVDVDRLTADSRDVLKMTYTNKDTIRKAYTLEGKDSEDVEIDFVGRQELVRSMTITEEDVGTATTYDDDTDKIKILANQEQTININSSIVNNYEATLNDVVIIGRIPFVGNKDGNGNDLGTNFDSKLKTALTTSGVVADIYYSEDGAAEEKSDSWTQDTSNLENFKSYKIVIREKTLAKGERISFEFNLTIPQSVGFNAVAYTNYVVYYKIDTQNYTNQCAVGMYSQTKEIDMDDIADKDKQDLAELTIGTQVSQGGRIIGETDTVYERQILKYTVVVKNTSGVTAHNVVIRGNAENSNLYYYKKFPNENVSGMVDTLARYEEDKDGELEYEEFTIDELAPGETKTFEYQVVIKDLKDIETPEVFGKISVSADNVEEKNITTFKNTIEDAKLEVRVGKNVTEMIGYIDLAAGSIYQFYAYIKNISGEELTDVNYEVYLPDTLKFVEIENEDGSFTYTVEKRTEGSVLIIHFDKMKADYEKSVYGVATVKDFDVHEKLITLGLNGKAIVGEDEYTSNDYYTVAEQSKAAYEYSWTADSTKSVLSNNDIVTYTFKLKNTGVIDIQYSDITNAVPDGLKIQRVTITDKDGTRDLAYNGESKAINEEIDLIEVGSEVTIDIRTIVDENLFVRDQQTIENKLSAYGGIYYDKFETEVISYKIDNKNVTAYRTPQSNTNNNTNNNSNNNNTQTQQQPSQNQQTQQPQTPTPGVTNNNTTAPKVITYYISGLAWVDSNQDGIRQSDEKLKDAVIVSLYKANKNGGIDTSSLVATTSTNDQGQYTFSNVENGKYVIVFDYNSSKYKVTKYQSDYATTVENSDAISKTVTINGSTQMLGVTDVLEINNTSLMSIDIGIVDKTNFDLKLEKMISSVTVKNDEGTKNYNYKDVQIGRLEIRSKYFKSSVVNITYKFRITNEGDVPGYVNKVVDYLPNGVQVVLNRSEGWYVGSDNGLYYTGLVDQEIAPGETKEFTLMLRRSLEDGESADLLNGAEIVETTNALGLFDRDSIENNQVKNEDDYGETRFIITVATGHTAEYITMTLVIIIMVSVVMAIVIKIKTTKKFYR